MRVPPGAAICFYVIPAKCRAYQVNEQSILFSRLKVELGRCRDCRRWIDPLVFVNL
jgi:hypothetical protein